MFPLVWAFQKAPEMLQSEKSKFLCFIPVPTTDTEIPLVLVDILCMFIFLGVSSTPLKNQRCFHGKPNANGNNDSLLRELS